MTDLRSRARRPPCRAREGGSWTNDSAARQVDSVLPADRRRPASARGELTRAPTPSLLDAPHLEHAVVAVLGAVAGVEVARVERALVAVDAAHQRTEVLPGGAVIPALNFEQNKPSAPVNRSKSAITEIANTDTPATRAQAVAIAEAARVCRVGTVIRPSLEALA